MTRPGSLARILPLLALLVAAGCRSGGSGAGAPADDGGPSATAGTPAGQLGAATHAERVGSGWTWTVPAPAWAGMPAADERAIAVPYGHQRLVLLDGDGRVQWEADRLGLRDVAPRLTAELVVAATDDGVAAFRRGDGTKLWDTQLGERANTPVVAGRVAVTSTWEGNLVGLDLGDGRVVWKAALPGPSIGPPAGDGSVVVATWDRSSARAGGAVAVDAATGKERWARDLPGGGISAPTVTRGSGPVAVMVAGDLAAHALALGSGEDRWRTPLDGAGSPEVPPAVVDAATVLVAHRLGGLDLLDVATGRRTWQVSTDGAATRGGPAVGPEGGFAVPLDDGRLLLAGPNRQTELLQPPTGRCSGVATGPHGWLVGATREGTVNTVQAGWLW